MSHASFLSSSCANDEGTSTIHCNPLIPRPGLSSRHSSLHFESLLSSPQITHTKNTIRKRCLDHLQGENILSRPTMPKSLSKTEGLVMGFKCCTWKKKANLIANSIASLFPSLRTTPYYFHLSNSERFHIAAAKVFQRL
ncbi:hypothetical protein CDAR_59051 [Caerostris darwini]|uniref:Uncharacterized protein n=1 Tax=Caerostris darwini TaxID=1538125 RepID=A0AAV4X5E2_9ARAC|nr:hypothetical protein CDAR_59051 [Caerostris darwini]